MLQGFLVCCFFFIFLIEKHVEISVGNAAFEPITSSYVCADSTFASLSTLLTSQMYIFIAF